MENPQDVQEVQKTPEEIIAELQAKVADLEPKAAASSQNFARLKKLEDEKKELEDKLKEPGESKPVDSADLEKRIEEKVSLRLAGHSPEEIAEIESYARGKGISLSEAAQSPFIQKAVDGLRAEKKTVETTPAPSKIKVFNGKPIGEVLTSGSAAEKQGAFESIVRKGNKSNE